jgi:hypothetical protein
LLGRIATKEFLQQAVVLAWHVDYWDRLGWKDTFAAPSFTDRQKRYRAALGMRYLVTPQLLANNAPVKGSQLAATVGRETAKAARLGITAAATLGQGKVTVRVKLTQLDAKLQVGKEVGVLPVLFQRTATTRCTAGENKDQTLKESFAVVRAGEPLSARQALEKGVQAKLRAPKGVQAGNLGVAILVEDRARMSTLECLAVSVGRAAAK